MSLFYGGARQVGFVVRDIERAMAHWSRALGVGPWFYKAAVGTTEFRYYGQAQTHLPDLSIALANSGELQIELIQQRNDAPSLYLDTLARNGECAQHIAYWTEDRYDAMHAQLLESGRPVGRGVERAGVEQLVEQDRMLDEVLRHPGTGAHHRREPGERLGVLLEESQVSAAAAHAFEQLEHALERGVRVVLRRCGLDRRRYQAVELGLARRRHFPVAAARAHGFQAPRDVRRMPVGELCKGLRAGFHVRALLPHQRERMLSAGG